MKKAALEKMAAFSFFRKDLGKHYQNLTICKEAST